MADLLWRTFGLNAGTPAPVVSRACSPEDGHRGMVHPIRLQPHRTIRWVSFWGMCRKVKNARVAGWALRGPTPLAAPDKLPVFANGFKSLCLNH